MELFKLLGTIAVENDAALKALDDTATAAEQSSEETQSAFSKIGGVAATIAKGIGAVGAILGGAWITAIESTREYREEMGKLDTAFQTAGHSSEAAKQTYSDLNAVLGDSGQAVEASQHLAKLTDNEKDLQTWTEICTGVYATFGESIPIESLTESANEVAKNGVLTGGLIDTLVWAGISEEKFQEKLDACTNEQERQDLIMNTLNKTYQAASTQYQETNADIIESRKAQERLTDAYAELGRVGEPIMTAVKNAVASMVEVAVPLVQSFIDKVKDLITWVKENESTIHSWVGVIIGASTAIGTFLLILNWSKIMTAAANAIKVVRTAILGMNAAMLANPIGLVVAAIVGLVAAFIYLWNNVEGFRKFWQKTWDQIKSLASKAWAAIKKTFSSIGSWFKTQFGKITSAGKSAMDNTKKWFSSAYKSVTKTFSNIGSWFGSKFRAAWSAVKGAFSGWGSFFSGLWTKVKDKFSSIGSKIGTTMGNAVKNGMNKVLSKIESSINKGIGLINSAIRLANKLPGIDVGTVPKVSLPRLARGGVLEKGQVGLLEGTGAEAVVPLEHNRAWLSALAVELHDIQSNQQNYQQPQTADHRIYAMLNRIVDSLTEIKNMKLCLDSGAMVGALTPAIDTRLADRWSHSRRSNTR